MEVGGSGSHLRQKYVESESYECNEWVSFAATATACMSKVLYTKRVSGRRIEILVRECFVVVRFK